MIPWIIFNDNSEEKAQALLVEGLGAYCDFTLPFKALVTHFLKIGMLNSSLVNKLCFINYAKTFDWMDHNKLWEILKEMGIPDHLTCLCMQVRKQQLELDMEQQTGSRKKSTSGLYMSPCFFNLYAEYIMRNSGLDEAQAGIKISGRNINISQICRWHHPYGREWRRTKKPLDEGEGGEWKGWLKAQHSEN